MLAVDPTAGIEVHQPDDRFVPIQPGELVAALSRDAARFGTCAAELRPLAELLQSVLAQEAAAFERTLLELYSPFNPDRDTLALTDLSAARTPQNYSELAGRLERLFDKANFERLSEVQIAAAIRAANTHGLKVRLRPERVETLAVWVRGRGTAERRVRTWRSPLRPERRVVPVYRRLAVVARLRDDPNVLLKMFKEIPIEDVEALLPHAEVEMNWFDRVKMFSGGAGALGSTATKVFGVLALTKLLWVVTIGLATLMVRTFLGYRRARINRDWQRTRHLYYQNLANNAGVIHKLVAMIAQEELKEALLAYAFCAAPGSTALRKPEELDRRIETYLLQRFGAQVDFDGPDAIRTLERLELWNDRTALRVVPPQQALGRLRQRWQSAVWHAGPRYVADPSAVP